MYNREESMHFLQQSMHGRNVTDLYVYTLSKVRIFRPYDVLIVAPIATS